MRKKLIRRKTRPKDIPKWMECTWRRKPCERDDCPICGRIKQDRLKHLAKGENPDDIKIVLADAGNNLKEALTLIREDARLKGIEISNIDAVKEPPEPEQFLLYQEVRSWQKTVFNMAENSQTGFWTYTEDAQDLFWYANTLGAKVYRQLCNRWEVENGSDYGDYDYQYTSYVLHECLKSLRDALSRLIFVGSADKGKLIFLAAQIKLLEKKIRSI